MENTNDKEKELGDIFYRRDFEFMVQHGLNGEVRRVLEEHFDLKEITLIRKKKEKSN